MKDVYMLFKWKCGDYFRISLRRGGREVRESCSSVTRTEK